jgi:hypothetical protein
MPGYVSYGYRKIISEHKGLLFMGRPIKYQPAKDEIMPFFNVADNQPII